MSDDTKNDVRVVFATPTLSHQVCLEYLNSIIQTTWLLWNNRINFGFLQRGGDPYLGKVRSKIATDFLRKYPNATDLFFLDDDVGWEPEAVIRFLERPEPVLAGIYPKKSDELDYPVHLCSDLETGKLIENSDGLFLAQAVPTGFLRIKRWVLEKMAEISGIFYDEEYDHSVGTYFNIFEMGVPPHRWWTGEDYAFTRKWIDMGGEVWVDPNIKFTHRGQKKWEGNLVNDIEVFRRKGFEAFEDYQAKKNVKEEIKSAESSEAADD